MIKKYIEKIIEQAAQERVGAIVKQVSEDILNRIDELGKGIGKGIEPLIKKELDKLSIEIKGLVNKELKKTKELEKKLDEFRTLYNTHIHIQGNVAHPNKR